MTHDKALRPDTFKTPSRAGGVTVKSGARLDAAEHDGIQSIGAMQAECA